MGKARLVDVGDGNLHACVPLYIYECLHGLHCVDCPGEGVDARTFRDRKDCESFSCLQRKLCAKKIVLS